MLEGLGRQRPEKTPSRSALLPYFPRFLEGSFDVNVYIFRLRVAFQHLL